jgi:predicted aspartyl protease
LPNIAPTAFTLKSNGGLQGVLITPVDIHASSTVNVHKVNAIWDTGATGSAITKSTISKLGLIPTGKAQVHTANGNVIQLTYLVDIRLPNGLLIQAITATGVDALSGGCDALIGMDVITLGDFSITNLNGITCMSFRIPSLHEIDYVKHLNLGVKYKAPDPTPANNYTGTARNSLCPCGSGKLYKRCHAIK